MTADSMIISAPDRQSVMQRNLYASLTVLAWFAWIWLWLPLITLVAWLLGFDHAYGRVVLDNVEHGFSDLMFLLRCASACALILVLWIGYNYLRFGGRERRREVEQVEPETIAHYFGANEIVSDRLRRMRRSVLHVDPSGRPVRAVIDRPQLPVPLNSDNEHGYDTRPATSNHPEELAVIK